MSDTIELKPIHRIGHILKRAATDAKSFDRIVNKRASLAGVTPEELFTFSAVISSRKLDSYFTRMSESSLTNYIADAQDGVVLLNSHRHNELGLGYSYDARGDGDPMASEDAPTVSADFYCVRGLNLNGLATDMFIRGIETDIIRDVSIGFSGGDYMCGICGLDLFDWDCHHIPGVEYDVTTNPEADPDEQVTEKRMAFAWIEDARLSEVSAVFDGANPDAMITKATREMHAGTLKRDTKDFLERKYRLNFTEPVLIPVDRKLNQKELPMGTKDESASGAPDKFIELGVEARFAAKAVGLDVKDDEDALSILRMMQSEIERLKPLAALAEEGKQLRAALVDDALKSAVRANGKDAGFNQDDTRKMLEALPVEAIRQLKSSWDKIGDATFAGTGRRSQDNPDPDPDAEKDGEGDEDNGEGDEDLLEDEVEVGGAGV